MNTKLDDTGEIYEHIQFRPFLQEGRIVLELEIPEGSPALDNLIPSDESIFLIPDVLIRVDLATLKEAISVYCQHHELFCMVKIEAEISSQGFAGKLRYATIELFWVLDRLCSQFEVVNDYTGTRYWMGLDHYFPFALSSEGIDKFIIDMGRNIPMLQDLKFI